MSHKSDKKRHKSDKKHHSSSNSRQYDDEEENERRQRKEMKKAAKVCFLCLLTVQITFNDQVQRNKCGLFTTSHSLFQTLFGLLLFLILLSVAF